MIRNHIANWAARLLRAAAGRIVTDLELVAAYQAAASSAELVGEMAGARACSSRSEVMKVALAEARVEGFVLELGVYRGDSLNELARQCKPEKVYGFDTFTGLPDFWRDGFPKGAFDVTGEALAFEENCVLYKGLFSETLPVFLGQVETPARLIHVDCDLYSSTSDALRVLLPRIGIGTVLVFDEYFNYPHWQQHEHRAFREFLCLTGLGCVHLAYNKLGQQVAVRITAG